MHVFVVVNKNCQFVVKNGYFTKEHLASLFQQQGLTAEIFFISAREIEDVVKQILSKNLEEGLVIVGGGDGTVSSVADLLVDTKLTLGVLPLGTLNHFAKDLGMPLEIETCIAIFSSCSRQKIDVGSINKKIFINNATLGMYPKIVRERDKNMRWFNLSKFSAMFLSAINIFHRFPVYQLKIKIDDNAFEVKTPLVFIGNNEYELDLFNFGTRQNLSGKQLCLYLVKSTNRWQFLKLLFSMSIGKLNQARDFTKILTTDLNISTRKPTIQVGVDGEIKKFDAPISCKIKPSSLSVCVAR